MFGRDYRIRTYDILLPKQALYQAELNPVYVANIHIFFLIASILFSKLKKIIFLFW